MAFRELQQELGPVAASLEGMTTFAEHDEFAPWVVECLRRAAFYASLSDEAVRECQADIEAEEAAAL